MSTPLQGVRVLDLSAVLSGPLATAILADQCADVVKIEPPEGDLMRMMGTSRGGMAAMFTVVNRNKRSVALDLKSECGRDALLNLARDSDVLVQNFRPGAVERMGIGYEVVRAVNPGIVYASITGFGADGPYANQRVYDAIIQAASGLAAAQGGSASPELIRSVICDKVTAIYAAQAITAALFARSRTGKGQHLTLSMLEATLNFMWPDVMCNQTLMGEGQRSAAALADLYRVTATANGYIVINVVADQEYRGLCEAIGDPGLGEDGRFKHVNDRIRNAEELKSVLSRVFATWETEKAVAALAERGVPCARVNRLDEIASDPQVRHLCALVEQLHPIAGALRQPRPATWFDNLRPLPPAPAPALGQHNREVLAEAELDPDAIAQLGGGREVVPQ